MIIPAEVYVKSAQFSGIAFAKCSSIEHRNAVMTCINTIPAADGKKTFAKPDQPFAIRTAEGAAIAFKKMLMNWNFPKSIIKIETNSNYSNIFYLAKKILDISIKDFELKLEWADGEWESWTDLQTSPELAAVSRATKTKFDAAKAWAGKGKETHPTSSDGAQGPWATIQP